MKLHVLSAIRAENESISSRNEVDALRVKLLGIPRVTFIYDMLQDYLLCVFYLTHAHNNQLHGCVHFIDDVRIPEACRTLRDRIIFEDDIACFELLRVRDELFF